MKTSEVTDKIEDWQDQATETVKNFGQKADAYLRDNTWTTIAAAAVVGCVVGLLLGRRG
jgi:ElaB/YqjD/DUF883 family membrane-anchored ribosome-binding protein